MRTRVSTKGQVVLPEPIRRRLGLQAGDSLDVSVEEGKVVLSPSRKHSVECKIITDPLTGFPVISAGEGAPILTSEEVSRILAEFP